jgi:1,4-alpha-glucan branching enzyme
MLAQDHINENTAMGANLTTDGATFKVWAPGAVGVYLNGTFGGQNNWTQDADVNLLLAKNSEGYWTGFFSGAREGDAYKFYVVGSGSKGYKRDPYARELSVDPPFPHANCFIRSAALYPWHDGSFVTPGYSNMIVYQLLKGSQPGWRFSGCDRKDRIPSGAWDQCSSTHAD